jgi:CheY-like chemotaxis protein
MEEVNLLKKLLYVEDDVYSQDLVKRVLGLKYQIDMVPDATSALEKINEEVYDGVLIDINLGHGIDGAQLMEKIKQSANYQDKPLIAITAYAAKADRDEFLERGFTHYISKPYHLKELKTLVDEAFS